jgi:mediator of RNA polymerase II transcription subunit 16, fungi type
VYRKIAWSKIGCVASISANGRQVNLRTFSRNINDGRWTLGKPKPLAIPNFNEDLPITHLSWGHLGTDLAVVDSAGRTWIYTNHQAIGRMNVQRQPTSDLEDELGAVVGLHWLAIFPHQQKVRREREAAKYKSSLTNE